jgi:hypothetical protein
MAKRFAVAILTPSTGVCRFEYAQSLSRLVMYFAQMQVFKNIKKQELITDGITGSGIAGNYETLVTKYLEQKTPKWTHFLSVEDDMSFAPDCLHILASRNLPIVGANYSTNKSYPLRFTAVGENGHVLTTEESTGVEEVTRLPQGFTLVAREVYESIPKPWFMVGYDRTTGTYSSQDYFFCMQAAKAGFKSYVDHDCSHKVVHIGPKQYTWEDALKDELVVASQKDKPPVKTPRRRKPIR